MTEITKKEQDSIKVIEILKKLDEKTTVRVLWTVQGMAMASGISAQEIFNTKKNIKI